METRCSWFFEDVGNVEKTDTFDPNIWYLFYDVEGVYRDSTSASFQRFVQAVAERLQTADAFRFFIGS